MILGVIISIIVLVYSAILHEIAHGYVAEKLGDPTARLMGRLTFNPKPHIDLYMSIILPAILFLSGSPVLFGGAKPVPVDPYNLKEGRKDIALVSLAGPLTNILIAILATLLYRSVGSFGSSLFIEVLKAIFFIIIKINVSLAVLNLLPIPPLDGSKVFALILPEELAQRYLSIGSIGIYLLLFLLVVPVGGFSLQSFIGGIYLHALGLLGF